MSNLSKNKSKKVLPEGIKDLYRLTPMQEGMYYVDVSGDKSSYVIQNFFLLGNCPEERKIREATELIMKRYESFRANFLLMSKGIFQIITEKQADYEYYDLSALSPKEQDSQISLYAEREVERGFDLRTDILIRTRCFRLNDDTIKCLWTYHHLIMDGWSLQNTINDFVRYYTKLSEGVKFEELAQTVMRECGQAPRFKDFVTWIYKQDKKNALAYWKELLAGYENTAEIKPIMNPSKVAATVARTGIKMDRALSTKIKDVFKNISLDTFLKAIWGITLQKYTMMQDVVFAEVVSGRNAELDHIEQMGGMLINVVPVRVKCEAESNFRDFLSEMHTQHIDSFAHSFAPLSEIQMVSGQKNELIKTLFVCENVDVLKEDGNPKISMVCESIREQTNYGLSVICSADKDEIKFELLYNPNEYSANEIRLLLKRIQGMITQVAKHPDIKIADIKMICEEEENLILNSFHSIEDYPAQQTVVEIFERCVQQYPNNLAIFHEKRKLSYNQLNEKANCVAHELRRQGTKPGDLVAISTKKSPEMIIGILGIIKAGAAFLPIDASYPVKRMEYIINDSRPKLLIKYKLDADFNIPSLDLETFPYQTKDYGNPDILTNCNDLLYCIYTSGTTGKPKGVLVEGRGVPNLRNYFIRQQQVTETDHILQFASMSFDAMISELTMSLLTGASLYIPSEEVKYDGKLLEHYLTDHGITIAILPPLLLNQIRIKGLRTVITAGAETNREIVRNNSHITVYSNDYGPTEATVCATYWKHKSGDYVPKRIPIGKPIPNSRVYIMDHLNLCGIGVPGEICIGGIGVARGYLNREELTAQKFIKDPCGEGMLYRTGDIGRWLEDGNIEFFGRQDEQVKIRGFRIELSEIEQEIRANASLTDIVVTTKENKDGNQFIVAYYTADEEIKLETLRKKLENYLPDYMIPLRMMRLEAIPLTDNGKIDKKALPEIEIASEKEYAAPKTDAEKALCNACAEILGVEKVGIKDEFFELGGDSIKAIRIVSKMRAFGYVLTVKDIMNRHTVGAISQEAVLQGNKKYDQGMVSGKLHKTPMLNQFVTWNLPYPERMTQDVMLDIETNDITMIHKALEALAKQHDMLRCIHRSGEFEILSISDSPLYSLREVDLSKTLHAAEEMEQQCMIEQNSFQLEKGPLMKAILFRTAEGSRLFICIHHISIDAISWQILMEDLHKAMEQAACGKKIELGEKTTSFQAWAEMLSNYQNKISDSEKSYWNKVEKESREVSLNLSKGQCQEETFCAKLNETDTEMLLRKTSRAYHTEINDLLICALGMSIQKVTGQSKVVVGLESHGREEIDKELAVDRTVGWFTSKYPVIVTCQEDIRNSLIQTKEMLRRVPMHGIGYGIIKGSFEDLTNGIGFNYLGEMDTQNRKKVLFNKSGRSTSNGNNLTGLLDFNCYIEDGNLIIHCNPNPSKVGQAEAESLLNEYVTSLKAIISHCCEKKDSEKTVSDYSAKELTERELTQIYKNINGSEVDDIYELTPQQEGMLYYAVTDETSTAYTVQNIFKLDAGIKEETILGAINLIALKHEILRTSIQYRKTDKPWQVIMKNRKVDYELISSEKQDTISADEVKRGFDLEKDSLIRVKCMDLKEGGWRLIWTYHHIITDGWCASVLFGDFLENISKIEHGVDVIKLEEEIISKAGTRGRYVDYVKWFGEDNSEILDYWSQYLQGYEETAEIKPIYKAREVESQVCRESIWVTGKEYEKITDLTGSLKITMNTVVETAVGITLSQYNHTQDVVFGKVVSGRDAQIKDIENIVGLFINTIPVRVNVKPKETIAALLHTMQENGMAGVENSRCSLSSIQGQIGCSGELIKVLFAFENYYIDEKRMHAFDFTMEQAREQTSYDITIVSYVENDELLLEILYHPGKYRENEIKLILQRISHIINFMCENKNGEAGKIETITTEEKNLILNKFNDTMKEYPDDQTIIEMFEKTVEENPNGIALIDGNQMLTFAQMNRKVNQLALKLRSHGVKPDDFVAIISKRSVEMILSIYAVMKSGGAYVPIDPDYPIQRKTYILKDCAPKAILTFGSNIDVDIPVIDLEDQNIWSGPEENPTRINRPEDLAYTIYTSGTTGKPKGVMIRHSGVAAMNSYMKNLYQPKSGDRVLQYANYVFDASVWEMTMALLNGATLVIIKNEIIADAILFEEYLVEHKITITILPPQFLFQLHDISCRILTTGGSASSGDVVEKTTLCDRYINAYGPTENTVLATHWERDHKEQKYNSIPIGKPIDNTRIYIKNHYGLCGIGMLGELCIAGAGLARGYLNNEELTKEKFIYDEQTGERIYRSGDLARWLPDGNIEYMGRIDEQVKIHGYRIELGEIESAIRAVDTITDAVVSTCKIGQEAELCAYYTADGETTETELKDEIGKILPSYMVPPNFIKMQEFPITPSGKIDKKKLPVPDMKFIRDKTDYAKAKNQLEEDILTIWSRILNKENIGIRDNFFDLGGNSLLVMSMQIKLNERYDHNVRAADIFSNPTIEALADFIKAKENGINCEGMVFKETYFRTIEDKRKTGKIRKTFDSKISQMIEKMNHTNPDDLHSFMLFVYGYVTHQETNANNIAVTHLSKTKISAFRVNIPLTGDFNEFKQIIWQTYLQNEKPASLKVGMTQHPETLSAAFCYLTGGGEGIDKKLFDFCITFGMEEGNIYVDAEIFSERTSHTGVCGFLESFTGTVEQLLDHI